MAEKISAATVYRVLARKYRPRDFSELIGQDALVRTLTNALRLGRLAHAYMLTGVRGIGKTTTARIVARAFNCVGADGKSGPTAEPCGVCEHCTAIAQDRHVDVIEMDAASRTGVDDVRDLIDSVQYRPVRARYKIFIVDEVHMLSKHAFNALLKTLEEPPEHVKFVFATTEIRKVPVTVLSRCQRFDLRRVDREVLVRHLGGIAAKEGAAIAPAALQVLARAADGSVRDGLSLLDRAIAENDGTSEIAAEAVRAMLGLADRSETLDLFDLVLKGDAKGALALAAKLYRAGAEPLVLVQDLLEIVHVTMRLKLAPEAPESAAGALESERPRVAAMATALGIAGLARSWQMLLKGLTEVQLAPQPIMALEMLLVRLAYVAELPTPGDLVKQLQSQVAATPARPATAPVPAPPAPRAEAPGATAPGATAPAGPIAVGRTALAPASRAPDPVRAEAAPAAAPRLADFSDVVALFTAKREGQIAALLRANVHLVRFEPGRIEIRLDANAPATLPGRVSQMLSAWTGERWVVTVSAAAGAPTLRQSADAAFDGAKAEAASHPVVRAVLDLFKGATILSIRRSGDEAPAAEPAPPPDDAAAGQPEFDPDPAQYEPVFDEDTP